MYQVSILLVISIVLAIGQYNVVAVEELDPTMCNYDHLLEQKTINESDEERKSDFRHRFDECLPVHEQWAKEAVERLTPDAKSSVLDYHKFQRDYDDADKPLAILLTKRVGKKKLKDVARDAQRFYSEIFSVQVDLMCSGFEGTLNELEKIYELVAGKDSDAETADEKINQVKVLYDNSLPTTFEWVIYARTCHLLKDHKKFLSEETRALFLDRKSKKSWASKLLHFYSVKCFSKNNKGDYDDPDDIDFESLH